MTGASGSGKSTLLLALGGVLVPTEGNVASTAPRCRTSRGGRAGPPARTRFGIVFQYGQLVPDLTAVENVALPLLLLGRSRRDALEAARAVLAELRVDDVADRRPIDMSGGQSQRVAIARALVTAPDVVLADEPTGSLDSVGARAVMATLLGAVRERGATLVVVTHDATVAAYCDREVRLRDGLVVGRGRGDDLGGGHLAGLPRRPVGPAAHRADRRLDGRRRGVRALAGAVVTPWDPASGTAYSNVQLWTRTGSGAGPSWRWPCSACPSSPSPRSARASGRRPANAGSRTSPGSGRPGASCGGSPPSRAASPPPRAVVLGLPLYALLAAVVGSSAAPSRCTGASAPSRSAPSGRPTRCSSDRPGADLVGRPPRPRPTAPPRDPVGLGRGRAPGSEGAAERPLRRRIVRSAALAGLGLVLGGILIYLLAPRSPCEHRLAAAPPRRRRAPRARRRRLAGELAVAVGARLAVGAGRADLLLAGADGGTAAAGRLAAHPAARLPRRRGRARLRADALAMSARQGDVGGFFAQTYLLLIVALGVATAGSALGLLVAEVESVVERRRSLATAVAAGVPRRVIARAVVIEAVLPVVPAVVVTTLVGALFARIFVLTLSRSAAACRPSTSRSSRAPSRSRPFSRPGWPRWRCRRAPTSPRRASPREPRLLAIRHLRTPIRAPRRWRMGNESGEGVRRR